MFQFERYWGQQAFILFIAIVEQSLDLFYDGLKAFERFLENDLFVFHRHHFLQPDFLYSPIEQTFFIRYLQWHTRSVTISQAYAHVCGYLEIYLKGTLLTMISFFLSRNSINSTSISKLLRKIPLLKNLIPVDLRMEHLMSKLATDKTSSVFNKLSIFRPISWLFVRVRKHRISSNLSVWFVYQWVSRTNVKICYTLLPLSMHAHQTNVIKRQKSSRIAISAFIWINECSSLLNEYLISLLFLSFVLPWNVPYVQGANKFHTNIHSVQVSIRKINSKH